MPGAQARLGLGRAGDGVLLQQPVGVRAPASALADQLDLGGALARHHALDLVAERTDGGAGHVAERRPLVAEDARVAVVVGADRVAQPDVGDDPREDRHRVLEARVLRIRLDALEAGLGLRALDLELRHEDRRLAADALGVDHRPLVREEPEAREVLDVVGAEEDVAREALAPDVLQQPLAPAARARWPRSRSWPRFAARSSRRVYARPARRSDGARRIAIDPRPWRLHATTSSSCGTARPTGAGSAGTRGAPTCR